ncbi:MAG: tRNA (adenosine(37)-N6)-threonylcarbamoyltransferase complex dimerization subunit type 1 TsaB [Planktomarina sp.]
MITLAFDTSAAHVAAALCCDGNVIADHFETRAKGQDQVLFGVLETLLAQNGLSFADVGKIGVGVGPGNFTGVRIAVSAAKGLALSLGVPAIGVNGFEQALYDAPQGTAAVIGAPRGQAYVGYGQDDGKLYAPEDLPTALQSATVLAGPGAKDLSHSMSIAVHSMDTNPAKAIAQIAATAAGTAAMPKPLYLKPADAAPSRTPAPVIM